MVIEAKIKQFLSHVEIKYILVALEEINPDNLVMIQTPVKVKYSFIIIFWKLYPLCLIFNTTFRQMTLFSSRSCTLFNLQYFTFNLHHITFSCQNKMPANCRYIQICIILTFFVVITFVAGCERCLWLCFHHLYAQHCPIFLIGCPAVATKQSQNILFSKT